MFYSISRKLTLRIAMFEGIAFMNGQLTQRYRKKFNTCKSGLTVTPLLFFIANSPPDSFRFAIFWASRNIAGRAFKIFVALTISGRRHTRAVSRTCQVMPLTWARVNTEIKKTNLNGELCVSYASWRFGFYFFPL